MPASSLSASVHSANGAACPGPAAAMALSPGPAEPGTISCTVAWSSSTRRVLPMPPSPSSRTAVPLPDCAARHARVSRATSASRPMRPVPGPGPRTGDLRSPAGSGRSAPSLPCACGGRRSGATSAAVSSDTGMLQLRGQPLFQLGERFQRRRRIAGLDQHPDEVTSGRLVQRAQRGPAAGAGEGRDLVAGPASFRHQSSRAAAMSSSSSARAAATQSSSSSWSRSPWHRSSAAAGWPQPS